MKAAFVTEFGKPLTIGEMPVPQPKDGQVLIKIEACGVCHTDVHAADGDWPVKPKPPFIPGHEGIGRVVAMGKNVKGVKEGDRVGVPWLFEACGLCDYCLTGNETCVLVGLPPGDLPLSIFDAVFRCLTIRGSLVGTRSDLKEALAFAAAGQVKATIETSTLDDVNEVLERLRIGEVSGRVVFKIA